MEATARRLGYANVLPNVVCFDVKTCWTSNVFCRTALFFMGSSASSSAAAMSAPALSNAIRQRVAQNAVVIYSKTFCPYCTMAKEVFDKLRQPYDVIELDQTPDGDSIQSALKEITGIRTVPQVFVKGKCIGGGTDTQNLYKQGKLQELLQG